MSDSSENEAAEPSDYFTVREDRDATVDIQRTIDEINDLFDSGAIPEPPNLEEMENDAAGANTSDSDSNSSDEVTDSSEDEMELEEIDDDFGMQRQEAPERINVMQAELRKEWMRKLETFPMRYV